MKISRNCEFGNDFPYLIFAYGAKCSSRFLGSSCILLQGKKFHNYNLIHFEGGTRTFFCTKHEFHFLRALSIRQNWPVGPVVFNVK